MSNSSTETEERLIDADEGLATHPLLAIPGNYRC